jgi:hypothetical protein
MGSFADISEVINRLSGGNNGNPQSIFWHKEWRVAGAAGVAPVAGQGTSLWEYEGQPSHGAVPAASWVNPDNTTQGGLKQVDPGGGRQLWLLNVNATMPASGKLIVYDRLGQRSGFSATNTGTQNVNGGPDALPTRYTNGVGNEIWIEIYTQIGATPTTLTVAYKNQAGASKTSQPVVFGGTGRREAQRFIRVPLAAGDTGVQALVSLTVLATTGTAGDFGILLVHPLANVICGLSNAAFCASYLDGSMPEILLDACVALAVQCSATTTGVVETDFVMAER